VGTNIRGGDAKLPLKTRHWFACMWGMQTYVIVTSAATISLHTVNEGCATVSIPAGSSTLFTANAGNSKSYAATFWETTLYNTYCA
jgi:hypothetical protein